MRAGLLYSGGKDSTLSALVLESFYEVHLVATTFGVTDAVEAAEAAGEAVGFPVETVELDEEVAREAVEQMVADGYPREGIQLVHEHALEAVAGRDRLAGRDVTAVADGTRRDDRVPAVDRAVAQSLEDRYEIDYVRPLAGYGRRAVDELVDRRLRVETGPSERLPTADYETELRALIAREHGPESVSEIFPAHTQSRVVGRRE